jgi:DNA-binding transcriptional ArsR family regulator
VTSASISASTGAAGRELPHPAREEIRLEGVLHALSDPMRLRIVRELAGDCDELTCSQFELPVTKSTTTHHFRVLRENGVIRQVYRGTAKMNGLRRDDLDELFPGLLDCLLVAADRQSRRLGPEG